MRAISFSDPRHSRVSLLRILALFVLALAAIPSTRGQQMDFKALAAQAAHAVEESKAENVVVFDFVGPETYVSELGRSMADEFSASLASSSGKFKVIDRAKMRQAVESNRFAPEIVAEPQMAAWLVRSIGAKSAILGQLSLDGSALRLTLDCFRVKDGKISGGFRVTYPLADEWKTLLAKNVDPDSAVATVSKSKSPPDPLTPTCKNCPKPEFTQAALDKRYQGTVVMLVVVGIDGRARDFRITKSLSYGMTVAAVQAVQKWTFNPSRGPNGEPIDVRVPIEVFFRLYLRSIP